MEPRLESIFREETRRALGAGVPSTAGELVETVSAFLRTADPLEAQAFVGFLRGVLEGAAPPPEAPAQALEALEALRPAPPPPAPLKAPRAFRMTFPAPAPAARGAAATGRSVPAAVAAPPVAAVR